MVDDLLFLALRQFEEFDTGFYFSTVNFTMLGYGDLVMTDDRRLLGAVEVAIRVLYVRVVDKLSLLGCQRHAGPGLAAISRKDRHHQVGLMQAGDRLIDARERAGR